MRHAQAESEREPGGSSGAHPLPHGSVHVVGFALDDPHFEQVLITGARGEGSTRRRQLAKALGCRALHQLRGEARWRRGCATGGAATPVSTATAAANAASLISKGCDEA